MPTKKDALEYLKIIKKYSKDYAKYVIAFEKWAKSLKPGEIVANSDGPGSNPPTPPPPPPPFPG